MVQYFKIIVPHCQATPIPPKGNKTQYHIREHFMLQKESGREDKRNWISQLCLFKMGKCVNIFTTKPYFTHEKYPNLFDTALISPGGLLSYKILIVVGLHLDYVWTSGFQFMGLSRLYLWPGTVFA